MDIIINGNALHGFESNDESREYLQTQGYTLDEINQAFAQAEADSFYKSERNLCKEVAADYSLGMISDDDFNAVELYIQSINPDYQQLVQSRSEKPPRPDILDKYK